IFLFQLALLRRWNDQEKELAVKTLQSQIELEQYRNKISSELHDDIGTTLSKINLSSYLAQTKLNKGLPVNVYEAFEEIQVSVQNLISRLKEIIWSIEKTDLSLKEYLHKIEDYGA